ncbi:unnamed protein product [Microthlaspi erraticum]|uniref:Uncharacterized protein n=1 Tax=Microthlaspi erraticum TaxID=1685480 RepID=A0A6D2IGI4_9BRAS|nr:unnamed protein product [Microthlaspi erraticum]
MVLIPPFELSSARIELRELIISVTNDLVNPEKVPKRDVPGVEEGNSITSRVCSFISHIFFFLFSSNTRVRERELDSTESIEYRLQVVSEPGYAHKEDTLEGSGLTRRGRSESFSDPRRNDDSGFTRIGSGFDLR